MGLIKYFEIKKRKKQNEKYFAEEKEVQYPIKLEVDNKNYKSAYKLAKDYYNSPAFVKYFTQTKLYICSSLIDVCYKLQKNEEVSEYINAYKQIDFLLNGSLHKNGAMFFYEIGKIMFENDIKEDAFKYLKNAYDLSNGTLFLTKEDKEKYLKFLNIKDDRTFEDFSQDY